MRTVHRRRNSGRLRPGRRLRRDRPGPSTVEGRQRTRRTCPSATSYRAPCSSAGTSSATAAVTMHLLRLAGERGQPAASLRVQLGEDVVEHQHRLGPVRAEQLVRPQPQRQRVRPGLAVAGVALRHPAAEREDQVVAVRADQRHPALHLGRPQPRQLGEQRGLQQVRGRLAGRQRLPQRARVRGLRRAAAAGDLLVRRRHVRGERPDQGEPAGQQLGAVPGQVAVPHVQRAQVARRRRPGAPSRPSSAARRAA